MLCKNSFVYGFYFLKVYFFRVYLYCWIYCIYEFKKNFKILSKILLIKNVYGGNFVLKNIIYIFKIKILMVYVVY